MFFTNNYKKNSKNICLNSKNIVILRLEYECYCITRFASTLRVAITIAHSFSKKIINNLIP